MSSLIWKGKSERLLCWYSLVVKNAQSKRTYIQPKAAVITERFGTTNRGEKKLDSLGRRDSRCLGAEPIRLKPEKGPSFSHPLGSATLA